jgi:hypothetical protein
MQLFCVTAADSAGCGAGCGARNGAGVGGAAEAEAEISSGTGMVGQSESQAAVLTLETTLIDEGVGPSNVSVINEADRDVIVSANREKGEAALYFVTD